jgi:hypothetical protein
MATRQEPNARKASSKKAGSMPSSSAQRPTSAASSSPRSRGGSSTLRSVVAGAASPDALLDLVERLGLVDLLLGRLRSRIEDTDVDEVLEEVTDYLRRNPEVLVVTLGAVTVATGLVVWLNNRREWDGDERRGSGKRTPARSAKKSRPRTAVEDDEVEEY